MSQNEVPLYRVPAQPGMLADSGFTDKVSRPLVDAEVTPQIDQVTVLKAVEGQEYRVLVNGIETNYVASDVDTPLTIGTALLGLLVANDGYTDVATFAAGGTTDIILVTGAGGEEILTVATDDGDGDSMSVQTNQAYAAEDSFLLAGLAVESDGDGGCKVPNAAAGKFLGVSVFRHTNYNPNTRVGLDTQSSGDLGYFANEPVSILRKGRIAVRIEGTIDPEVDGIFYRHTAPGSETKGAFRGTADGVNTTEITSGAEWVSVEGDVAILSVNFPV